MALTALGSEIAGRDEAPPLLLAADARLDNRDELARALGRPSQDADGLSDGVLILGAYERWGEDCLHHLHGAFAFVLWDSHRRAFFGARDPFGLRPFYYVRLPNLFAVASRVEALLALPEAPRRLNETTVADYLMNMPEDQEATFYEGVLRLPPAHALTVTPDGVRRRRYWAPDPHAEVRLGSDDAYAEAYRTLFFDAVRARLPEGPDAGHAGFALSGGLDSSSIVCAARVLTGATDAAPLDTFSFAFDAVPTCDERPYVEAVLAQGGLRPHFVAGDRLGPLDDLDAVLDAAEEPPWMDNLFQSWQVWDACRTAGVSVYFEGFLGDQVIGHGDRYLTELAAGGRWLTLAREVRVTAGLQRRPWRAARRLLHHYALDPLVAEPARRALRGPEAPLWARARERFVRPDLLQRLAWAERAHALDAATPRTVRQEQLVEIEGGWAPRMVETGGKLAAAFGVELRLPFADRRLLEFCLALPPTQRYHAGWTRVIARRALHDLLPAAVRERYGKANLAPNFERGLRERAPDVFHDLLFAQLPLASPYLDVHALQAAARAFLAAQNGRYSAALQSALWRAAVLTRWLAREQTLAHDKSAASGSLRLPHAAPPHDTPSPDAHGAPDAPGAPKKPYLPPQVETYGTVGALTGGPFGGISDTFAGGTGGFQTFSP